MLSPNMASRLSSPQKILGKQSSTASVKGLGGLFSGRTGYKEPQINFLTQLVNHHSLLKIFFHELDKYNCFRSILTFLYVSVFS